jgi:hypothetical protein
VHAFSRDLLCSVQLPTPHHTKHHKHIIYSRHTCIIVHIVHSVSLPPRRGPSRHEDDRFLFSVHFGKCEPSELDVMFCS